MLYTPQVWLSDSSALSVTFCLKSWKFSECACARKTEQRSFSRLFWKKNRIFQRSTVEARSGNFPFFQLIGYNNSNFLPKMFWSEWGNFLIGCEYWEMNIVTFCTICQNMDINAARNVHEQQHFSVTCISIRLQCINYFLVSKDSFS